MSESLGIQARLLDASETHKAMAAESVGKGRAGVSSELRASGTGEAASERFW